MPILPLLLFLLAGSAAARPCKTIFYFSSATTSTFYPYSSLTGNPNPDSFFQSPRHFTLIFTSTRTPVSRVPDDLYALDFNSDIAVDDDSMMTSSDLPMKLDSPVYNSIRGRTRDIMSVVGALLFGVACGALTAAIMYFMFALFSPRHFDLDEVSSSDDDDDDDDVTAAKKFGYVAIPGNPKIVDDDLKKSAPIASEAV